VLGGVVWNIGDWNRIYVQGGGGILVATKRRRDLRRPFAAVLFFLFGLLVVPALGSGPPPDAEYIGAETCMDCHDDVGEAFWNTTHGHLLKSSGKYSENLCESCHGPGSAHVEEGDAELILNPTNKGERSEDMCLSCHSDGTFMEWRFSSHAMGDIGCTDCHEAHVPAGQILKKSTPELCYDCHQNVRADFFLPSHHPVAEGKLGCESCHPIHGGENQWVMGQDKRELCFTCHPSKEGPFVFEHDPVNEECSICHQPHGSIADNLLVQSEPTLCLNCHSMHFHASIPGIESDGFTSPQDPSRTLSSTHDGFKEAMLTKCTQCHTQVHGSDLPSQSISGGGTSLTR